MKICSKCGIEKDLTNFSSNRNKCKDCKKTYNKEYNLINRDQINKRQREWNLKNPIKNREYKIKKAYNLSTTEYNILFSKQNGKCAICNKEAKLNIDHCHTTGKVRGLLCPQCNCGIGYFKDSLYNLTSAYRYLFSFEPRSRINRESGSKTDQDTLFRLESK